MGTVDGGEIPWKMNSREGTITRKLSETHDEVINELGRNWHEASLVCKIDSLILQEVLITGLNISLIKNNHTKLQSLQIDLDAKRNIDEISFIG